MSDTPTQSRTLIASIAGGPARQYRVQIIPPGEEVWRLFACYRNSQTALEAARRLEGEGLRSRVLAVRICPTAA